MKKILNVLFIIIKKVILSFCLIYAFNLIAAGLNIVIPINLISISTVSFLGIPGLISLVGVYFIII